MLKRLLDLCVSGMALLAFSPLLLGLAIAIKWSSPGPVFYRGRRAGRNEKPFRIFKFRSMVINADKIGGASTSDRDPRITGIGFFMRKYKLDELPQLINVFVGDMSLVGPRPQVCDYVARYSTEERAVLAIRPGITDWASIWNSDEGAVLAAYDDPDAAYDRLIHPTKMKLQLRYAHHHSVLVDIKIICYTLLKMFRKGWVPAEIADVPQLATVEASPACASYETVTELPGAGATPDQLAMLHTRYAWAAEYAKDKDVLEVGCGSGIGLQCLSSVAKRVVGGDYDPNLVEKSKQNAGDQVAVQQMDAQDLPFDDQSFDVVLLLEALYYVPDAARFVKEARRVLRPGGVLLINSANCERGDFNPSPFSIRYHSANELHRLLAQHGFHTTVYAGFPIAPRGVLGNVRQGCRKLAVRLHLIPRQCVGKRLSNASSSANCNHCPHRCKWITTKSVR
jgi:lipopolysaccharide/colanic/teichoic acid biosynthesis glycosyltransferase/2-polyprenyl-3-methyl-5-hydroxy-6-metoxy-1,4-benzoquinol methylase